jgi:hypothetical protein
MTSPNDLLKQNNEIDNVEHAIKEIDKWFANAPKKNANEMNYNVELPFRYTKEVYKEVIKLYKENGWKDVRYHYLPDNGTIFFFNNTGKAYRF